MAEFEASRIVHARPSQLFAIASDVARLPEWVPPADAVDEDDTGTLHLQGRDGETDARWRAEPDQRRIEWGSAGSGDYAGWLQVVASGTDDMVSEAVLHLSFFGDEGDAREGGKAARDVQGELEESLDALARLAEQ